MIRLRLLLPLLAALLLPHLSRADTVPAVPIGGACKSDAQCAIGSICNDNFCTALPQGKRVIPFYFHQPGDVGHRYITPILWFHKWDREGSTSVQVPFFAHTKNYAERSSTTVVPLLLFWAGRYEGRGAQVGWMPFFYWQNKGTERRFVAPLLLSGWHRDEITDSSDGVVALVGWYRKRHDSVWRILFPLLWDHQTKDSRTAVALPLGVFHRDGPKRIDVVFPFAWHWQDAQRGTRHMLFLPLLDWDSDRHGRREQLISVIAAWSRDDDAQMKQLIIWAPPVFTRRDHLREIDVVPPLFTRWRVKEDGSTGLIAGPFFYHSDLDGSTTGLFPIYWRFADRKSGAETQFLFPVAGFHKHRGAAGGFVGPVYGWRSTNGLGGWGGGVAPVAMFGRSGTRSHQVVLPPLFVRAADSADGSATTVVGPVFHKNRGIGRGWDAGLFPLVWFGGRPDGGYGYVPPIFFHRQTRAGTTDVVGPLFVQRGPRGWSAGLVPLAFFGSGNGRSHQVVLPPLFVHTKSPTAENLLIGPFYHGHEGARRVDVLFPLLYLRRAPHDGLMVGPLVGWRRDTTGETAVLGPYIYRRNDVTHARTHFLFPLLAVHDAPDYHVVVQFPFFWHVREGRETDTTIFPLYFAMRAPDKRADAILPLLFFHSRTSAASTTVVGPLWARSRTDGGRSIGLFPLFAYGKIAKEGKASRYFGMPGAFYYENDFAATTKAWVGPFFLEKHDGGYTSGVIPLVWAWKRDTATSVLAPFFWHRTDRAADTSITVAGPVYWGHSAEVKKLGLFPLTFNKWRPDGTFTASVFPLFYLQNKTHGSIFATLIFGWSRYATGVRAYVGPIYVRHDAEISAGALFPLAYFSKNHVTGSVTRMILPLYFDARRPDGRQLQEFTPLVWRFHSVERTVIVGLPLFFDVNSFGESRSTGLLPLFVRNRSLVSQSTSWVFPPLLTWVRKRHDVGATDAVVFPLVWRYGGQDPTTVVAPLWWDFKRGSSRTLVFAPFGAHWKRQDDEFTLFLNFYYHRGRGLKEGRWYVDVFPLAEFGRPRKGDVEWKVLEGLFGYSRLGRNRILHLFWLFDIALEPAAASSLTWFGSTPASARSADLF